MSAFYVTLDTPRLVLRKLTPDDAEAVFALRSNEQVQQYIDRPAPGSMEDITAFIDKINKNIEEERSMYWVICLKGFPQLMGTICLWNFSEDKTMAETGYELSPAYQQQGFMHEALQAVIRFAFAQTNLSTIEAYTHCDNTGSAKLLEKTGFKMRAGTADPENMMNVVYKLDKPD